MQSSRPALLSACLILGSVLLAGCGAIPVSVKHGRLPRSAIQRDGTLAVTPFKDTREVSKPDHLGEVRGVFGNHVADFVSRNRRPIAAIVEDCFVRSLKHVGYTITDPPNAPVTVEADVFEFTLESSLNNVARIGVLVRVRDTEKSTVLWEKEIHGKEDDILSLDNAVRAALDVALANAIREFSSLDFHEAVQRKNRRALEH